MNDITKLPKWAQQRITLLEGSVEHLKGELSRLTGETPTRVSLHYPGARLGEPIQFLPDNQSVYFRFRNQHVQVRLDEREGVRITSSASALHIQPYACNAISIVPSFDTLEAPEEN